MSVQIDVGPSGGCPVLVSVEEAVTQNTTVGVVWLPGEPTDAEAWQLAEAFRDSDYMGNRTENALTITSVYVNKTVSVEEPS